MPRIKPPRNAIPERIDREDPTEPIEIMFNDDSPDEIEIDLEAPPVEKEPEPAPVSRKVEPEPVEDDALAKALEAQRRAEELQRTAQRERDEAVRRARDHEQELVRERGDREDAQYNSVLTAIAAEQSAVQRAKVDFASAMTAQDFAAAAEAQAAMASAAARLDRLEDGKQAFETKREALKTAPPEKTTAPKEPDFEQRISALPETARGWLRKHPEFINDAAMNRKIQAAHGQLVEFDNVEPFSAAYFDAMDSKFGFKAAPVEPAAPQRRSMPMSAPVSRQAPSPSGQRQSNSMTLTPEERAIARNSFGPINGKDMTIAEKEYLYAQNKKRYQTMRANGTYTEQKQ